MTLLTRPQQKSIRRAAAESEVVQPEFTQAIENNACPSAHRRGFEFGVVALVDRLLCIRVVRQALFPLGLRRRNARK